jgi:hypothetical protein
MCLKNNSIDLLYDITIKQHELISRWADSIDNKIIALFGITLAIFGVVLSMNIEAIAFNVKAAPLVLSLLFFAASSICGLEGISPKPFSLFCDQEILSNLSSKTNEEIKSFLVEGSAKKWKRHKTVLEDKARALKRMVILIGCQVILLTIWLIII